MERKDTPLRFLPPPPALRPGCHTSNSMLMLEKGKEKQRQEEGRDPAVNAGRHTQASFYRRGQLKRISAAGSRRVQKGPPTPRWAEGRWKCPKESRIRWWVGAREAKLICGDACLRILQPPRRKVGGFPSTSTPSPPNLPLASLKQSRCRREGNCCNVARERKARNEPQRKWGGGDPEEAWASLPAPRSSSMPARCFSPSLLPSNPQPSIDVTSPQCQISQPLPPPPPPHTPRRSLITRHRLPISFSHHHLFLSSSRPPHTSCPFCNRSHNKQARSQPASPSLGERLSLSSLPSMAKAQGGRGAARGSPLPQPSRRRPRPPRCPCRPRAPILPFTTLSVVDNFGSSALCSDISSSPEEEEEGRGWLASPSHTPDTKLEGGGGGGYSGGGGKASQCLRAPSGLRG